MKQQDPLGMKSKTLSDKALIMCVVEVGFLLFSVATRLALGHGLMLVNSLFAISWLLVGGGSVIVSIAGLVKGEKNFSSVSVVAMCIAIFFLCAFQFALV